MDAPINITFTFPAFELAFSVCPCKDIFPPVVEIFSMPEKAILFSL
jgi:hypothetical protein